MASQEEPLLGLATTRELLVELKTRFYISGVANERGARLARKRVETILELAPEELLDYRTVGSL